MLFLQLKHFASLWFLLATDVLICNFLLIQIFFGPIAIRTKLSSINYNWFIVGLWKIEFICFVIKRTRKLATHKFGNHAIQFYNIKFNIESYSISITFLLPYLTNAKLDRLIKIYDCWVAKSCVRMKIDETYNAG